MLKGFKEAKERDHRKIGKDLKIFMTSELVVVDFHYGYQMDILYGEHFKITSLIKK